MKKTAAVGAPRRTLPKREVFMFLAMRSVSWDSFGGESMFICGEGMMKCSGRSGQAERRPPVEKRICRYFRRKSNGKRTEK